MKNFQYRDDRQKAVYSMLMKYSDELEHSIQVCKLSLNIFEITKGKLHNFSDEEKYLLEAGSLLHDIGYFIDSRNHNKHAYKMIISRGIEGFTNEEIEIIANITRYHRGKLPSKKHKNYTDLPKETRGLIKKLGGIVKLADGFDRSRYSIIKNLECIWDDFSKNLTIIIDSEHKDCSPDLLIAMKKKDLLEKALEINIKFDVK
ncbi:MAG: HD domain-containing protein [Candidatus Gastranaerophilales bacterium]|nr:HD domain-containing protein [Candidatus Gastranaerophilales bacterium]